MAWTKKLGRHNGNTVVMTADVGPEKAKQQPFSIASGIQSDSLYGSWQSSAGWQDQELFSGTGTGMNNSLQPTNPCLKGTVQRNIRWV
jgi:hypothetical protein